MTALPASPAPLCPECGTPADARPKLRRGPGIGLARYLPLMGVLAVLALLILGAVFGNSKWSSAGGVPTTFWEPAGRLTIADLDAIKSGERDGSVMIRALREFTSRPIAVGGEPIQ